MEKVIKKVQIIQIIFRVSSTLNYIKQKITNLGIKTRWDLKNGCISSFEFEQFYLLLIYFKQIIICYQIGYMLNWRFSYDAQKSKFNISSQKTLFCPAFLGKSIPEKNQTPQNTESPFYLKKGAKNNKSGLKSLDASKSPIKVNEQKCFAVKTPKKKTIHQNLLSPLQQNVNTQHKSSFITQDSYSSLCGSKTLQIQKFKVSRELKGDPQKNLKQNKKQRTKTSISPIKQKLNLTKFTFKPRTHLKKTPEKVSEKVIKNNSNVLDLTTIEDFEFLSQLGRGFNSIVYLARHKKLGMIFAIKLLAKQTILSENLQQIIFRQIKIHSFVKNSNIISLYKILFDSKFIYLVMEYATGGTLYSLTKKQRRMPEQKIAKLIRDICRGLKYLHDNNIIHRDLKLQNILISEGIAKIGDFGCAVYTYCMRKSNIGSPAYLSPEQLHGNFYGKKIDIWSIGILAYEMLFQMTPFDKQIIQALHKGEQSVNMNLKFPVGTKISSQAKDFLIKCLQKKQSSRLNIDQVLNHPFLSYEAQLHSTKS